MNKQSYLDAIMKKIVVVLSLALLTSNSILFLPTKAQSKTIIVPDDYTKIQDAVDHANVGDTVFVKKGTYHLPAAHIGLNINKSISLIGENNQDTIITATPYRYADSAIRITADDVTISGFTIDGTLRAIEPNVVGICLENIIGGSHQPSGCRIINNVILNNWAGIITRSFSKDNIISGNTIINNTVHGIHLSSSDSIISNNTIIGNKDSGITIVSCEHVTVKNNTIIGNENTEIINQDQAGIHLRWLGNFEVYGNNISNNSYGIQFGEGCSNSLIHDNNIKDNRIGVMLSNFVLTNNSDGIGIGTGSKVYRNNLDNTKNAFIQTAYPYGNVSNIAYTVGNGTDVVFWDNGVVGNFWGDYTGQGIYVIDENNVDHYPLAKQVDISIVPSSQVPILIIVVISTVSIAIVGVILLIYFKKHKR
jgi:parallel beta-helix repeat protein